MSYTSTISLKEPKLQQVRGGYDGSSPFPPITRAQFLKRLQHSHEQAMRGEYRDADVVIAELRQKYVL